MTDERTLIDMRRKNRAEDEDWIRERLRTAPFGFLAVSSDEQPYINMNTFVYDPSEHALYFHTAGAGRLNSVIEKNNRACFAIGEMGRLLPAKVAREFSVEYSGVIVFGRCRVIEDMTFARDKMQLLNEKYFPHLKAGSDYRPITPKEIAEISAYELKVEQWSGKKKEVEEDFPGAFCYPAGGEG